MTDITEPVRLTPAQLDVLKLMAVGQLKGRTPSMREIGDKRGSSSTNTVMGHFHQLVWKKCLIWPRDGKACAIRLTPLGWRMAGYVQCCECGQWRKK